MSPFRSLCASTAVDGLGSGATAAALPLLVAAHGRDAGTVALVAAAASVPVLVVSLPLGAVVDRVDRRALLRRTQLLSASLTAVLAAVAAADPGAGAARTAALCALQVGLGSAQIAFTNANQAVLPAIVDARGLPRANARLYLAGTLTEAFLGPPIGSALFALGAALPFGVDAASFAASAVLLARLPPTPPGAPTGRRLRTDVVDGLRWLLHSRRVRTLALLLGCNSFANQLAGATMVLLVTRTLGAPPAAYGLVLGVSALGAVAGATLAGRLLARARPGRVVAVVLAATSAAYLGIGIAPDVPAFAALSAVIGAGVTIWNVATVSLRQASVPAELFGRVNSAYRLIGWGLMPFGALTGGVVAHELGLRATFPVAGAVRVAGLLLALPVLASWDAASVRPRG